MKPEAYEDSVGPCVVACFGPEGDYRLRDGLLEIRSEAGETTSILEPLAEGEEPRQEGTPWELRYFVENGKKTPALGEPPIALTFDRGTLREEGSIFGSTGCNDYRAAYEYPSVHNTLERIVVDDPVAYPRECPGPLDPSEEERFFAVLGDLGEYPDISMGGRITLEARGGRKLLFSAHSKQK